LEVARNIIFNVLENGVNLGAISIEKLLHLGEHVVLLCLYLL